MLRAIWSQVFVIKYATYSGIKLQFWKPHLIFVGGPDLGTKMVPTSDPD
jgi:hypothetical protein